MLRHLWMTQFKKWTCDIFWSYNWAIYSPVSKFMKKIFMKKIFMKAERLFEDFWLSLELALTVRSTYFYVMHFFIIVDFGYDSHLNEKWRWFNKIKNISSGDLYLFENFLYLNNLQTFFKTCFFLHNTSCSFDSGCIPVWKS